MHRTRCRRRPQAITGGGVERDDVAVVGADVDHLASGYCSGVDIRACLLGPDQLAALRAVGVHPAIGIADEDTSVRDGRRGVEVLPAATQTIIALRFPTDRTGRGIKLVHAAAVGTDHDRRGSAGSCRVDPAGRRDDLGIGRGRPLDRAGRLIEGVDLVVPGADVDGSVLYQRRRLHRWQLGGPLAHTGLGIPGVHEAAAAELSLRARILGEERGEDDAVVVGGGGGGAVARTLAPRDRPVFGVDREEPPVQLADVHHPVGDDRRKLEQAARVERPVGREGRLVVEVRIPAGSRVVEAVGRPVLRGVCRCRSGRRGVGGDELLGRVAGDLGGIALSPSPPAAGTECDQHDGNHQEDPTPRPAPALPTARSRAGRSRRCTHASHDMRDQRRALLKATSHV